MNNNEVTAYFRLSVICFLMLLGVTQCNYQNDTIAAVKAVGVQCSLEYTIEIPENFNQEGE